jgi:cytochrome c peroxidase
LGSFLSFSGRIQMKKVTVTFILFLAVYTFVSWQKKEQANIVNEEVRKWLLAEIKACREEIFKSLSKTAGKRELQEYYHNARRHYKYVEFFIEYHSAKEAKYFINGPLVAKHNHESNEAIAPQGFQRIEELLFDDPSVCDTVRLNEQYNLLLVQLSNLYSYYQAIEIEEGVLLEMCQLQLLRIASMNLNGSDATLSQTNVMESYWCIEGMEKVVEFFKPFINQNKNIKGAYKELLERLSSSGRYLYDHPDYDKFDRLNFIIKYINPLNRTFIQFHNACQIPWSNRPQAIQLRQGFLFGRESFNNRYFSMYFNDTINISQQGELGRVLFFDPALSGNNQRSCASCHNPSKAFTDGYDKSLTFDKVNALPRNTPGLFNVLYQKAFFYDGRAYQLEQQAFDVIHNKNEMQSSLDEVAVKLRKSNQYRKLFSEAFSGTPDSIITTFAIKKAIAEYEKTLISFNSRFDQYLHGNYKKMNAREINGYNLFAGKALCGSCHFLPLFNGTVPPSYNDSEYEVIGVPIDSNNKELDPDIGRFFVTNIPEQKNAFKTPSLRNIELTAPYMHNGVYTTLEQVMDFYHKGGGAGLKYSVPNQTLPFDSLKLSSKEKEDIILFLKTLTDTSGVKGGSIVLPVFEKDAFLNARKSGGEY